MYNILLEFKFFITYFGASIFVEQNKQYGEHNKYTNENTSINQVFPYYSSGIFSLCVKWRIDEVTFGARVVRNDGSNHNHHQHTNRHRNKKTNDLFRAVDKQTVCIDTGALWNGCRRSTSYGGSRSSHFHVGCSTKMNLMNLLRK